MVKLIAQDPFGGMLPVDIGTVSLTAVVPDKMTSIAPFQNAMAEVSTGLNAATMMTFPQPNRMLQSAAGRILWIGTGAALLIDADCPELPMAAITDQTDAWAIVQIKGSDCEDVLARLVPVDFSKPQFKVGHTARTMIGHMTGSVTRVGPDAFEVMVMRSMAATLMHDLKRAATGVAAR